MNKIEMIDLTDIDATNNIRRASPLISSAGFDLLKECVIKGLGNSMTGWNQFLTMLACDSKIITMIRSLAITGQIHPITVVKMGKRYRCISGQRRYVGMVGLECLRNVLRFGETEEITEAKKIFETNFEDQPRIDFDRLQKQAKEIQIQSDIRIEMSESEIESLAFAANEEVLPLSDIDWANWVVKKREEINPDTGTLFTWEQLAKISNQSIGWLRLRQNLKFLPPEWQHRLDTKEITITKAAAYAEEIVEAGNVSAKAAVPEVSTEPAIEDEEGDDEPVMVTPPAPKKRKLTPDEMPERPDGSRIEWEEEEDEIEAETADPVTEEPEVVPVKDWTEGKRKKRSAKKAKMLSYDEVINLLRSLDKTDVHGIDLLAKVLQMPFDDAEALAGSSAEAAE